MSKKIIIAPCTPTTWEVAMSTTQNYSLHNTKHKNKRSKEGSWRKSRRPLATVSVAGPIRRSRSCSYSFAHPHTRQYVYHHCYSVQYTIPYHATMPYHTIPVLLLRAHGVCGRSLVLALPLLKHACTWTRTNGQPTAFLSMVSIVAG